MEEKNFCNLYLGEFDVSELSALFEGKTIKYMNVNNSGYSESNRHILILFTDNTYVLIGISGTEDDGYLFTNKYEYILTDDGRKKFEENPLAYGHFDGKKFKIDSIYQDYIEAGIIKMDEDKIQKAIQKRQQEIEDTEYKEYLRLKEKYGSDKRDVPKS